MVHELKISPENFNEIADGIRNFEIRKNDRDFMVGDTLALNEWENEKYTGQFILMAIKKIFRYPCLADDYIIMSLDADNDYALGQAYYNRHRLANYKGGTPND